jgi:hypothetical protein
LKAYQVDLIRHEGKAGKARAQRLDASAKAAAAKAKRAASAHAEWKSIAKGFWMTPEHAELSARVVAAMVVEELRRRRPNGKLPSVDRVEDVISPVKAIVLIDLTRMAKRQARP